MEYNGWHITPWRGKVNSIEKTSRVLTPEEARRLAAQGIRLRPSDIWIDPEPNERGQFLIRNNSDGELLGFYAVQDQQLEVVIFRYAIPIGLMKRFIHMLYG